MSVSRRKSIRFVLGVSGLLLAGILVTFFAFKQFKAPEPGDAAPVPPSRDVLVESPPHSSQPQNILPKFPWPPPEASASYVLPSDLFKADATIGQLVSAILSALSRQGYVERSFFETQPGGIALVTHIEEINNDGYSLPASERWPANLVHQSDENLVQFLRGLLYVKQGRFRVIVFVIQAPPFSESSETISGETARDWLRSGANVLPPAIAEQLVGDATCTALIYEFTSDGVQAHLVQSKLTGLEHLQRAGILPLASHGN
jgi:hypothetical protein